MAGKMTVDELLGNMPKMMRIADDMALASCHA